MVCRIEALVQVHQLCAQVLDVPVKVLEGFVSEVEERRSDVLTSSEKPGMSYGVGVGQRKKSTKLGRLSGIHVRSESFRSCRYRTLVSKQVLQRYVI